MTTTTPTDQQLAASRRHQDANPRSLVGRHFTAGGLLVNEYTHGLLVAFDAAGRQIVDVGISW